MSQNNCRLIFCQYTNHFNTMFVPYLPENYAEYRGSEKKREITILYICFFLLIGIVASLCASIMKGSPSQTPMHCQLGDQHLKVWRSRTTIVPSGLGEGRWFCYCRPLTAGNTVQLSTVTYISYWGASSLHEWISLLAADVVRWWMNYLERTGVCIRD